MEKSFVFDAVLVDGVYDREYLSEDFCNYFKSFISDGVFPNPSTNLQVMASSNMDIVLNKGKAFKNGRLYENTEPLTFTIEPADGVLNRIDTVVLQVDNLKREFKAVIKKGTFAVNPIPQELLNNADYEELKVAEVYVKAGMIKINQADITDTRLDKNVCGLVSQMVQTVDTSTLYRQIQSDLEKFNTEEKAKFLQWFDGIKTILDENTAGNLLNLINAKADKNTVYTKQETDSKLTEQKNYTDTQLSEKTGINATATYTNNAVTITAPVSVQQITFIAPSDFSESDTYTINGTQVTITDLNNEPLSNAWKQGSPVQLILKGNKAFFKSGGGASFPKSWQDRQIGEATEYIAKDSPIQYNSIGGVNNLSQLPIPSQLKNSGLYGRSTAISKKYVAISFSIEVHIYEKAADGTTLNFIKKYTASELGANSVFQCAYIENKLIILVDKSPYILMYDNYGLGNKMAAVDVPLPVPLYKLASNGTDTVVMFGSSSANTGMFVYKYDNNALRLLENTSPYYCQAAAITTVYTNGSPDIVAMQKRSSYAYINMFKYDGSRYNMAFTIVSTVGSIVSMSITPDNKFVYCAGTSYSNKIMVHEIKAKEFIAHADIVSVEFGNSIEGNIVTSDGKTLIAGGGNKVALFNIENKSNAQLVNTIDLNNEEPYVNGAVEHITTDIDNNFFTILCRPRTSSSPYSPLRIYAMQSKDVVSILKTFNKKIGIALESKNVGQQIKVNLFPPLNNL